MSARLGTAAHVLVSRYGLLGVFLAMIVESVGIPLPSEVTMPLGALGAVGRGWAALLPVVIAGTAGNAVGSMLAYVIGWALGRGWRGSRLPGWLNSAHAQAAQRWFARRGNGAVFFGRLLPVVRTYISFPAGAAAMPLPRFLLYTLLGSAIWCAALAVAGYALGSSWGRIQSAFVPFTAVTVVALVVAAAVAVAAGRRRRH